MSEDLKTALDWLRARAKEHETSSDPEEVEYALGLRDAMRKLEPFLAATPAGVTAQVGQDWPSTKFLTASRVALVSLAHAAEKHGIYKSDYERFAAAVNEFASPTTPAAGQDDARDAARYRWLRHGDNDERVIQHGPVAPDYHWLPRNERLDAMIDAAMSTAPASEPLPTPFMQWAGKQGFDVSYAPASEPVAASEMPGMWEPADVMGGETDIATPQAASVDTEAADANDICQLPPADWYCTRKAGHDGPCAAHRHEPDRELDADDYASIARGMARIKTAEAAQAGSELAGLVSKLQDIANDPMWPNHVEVSKRTLCEVIGALAKKSGGAA